MIIHDNGTQFDTDRSFTIRVEFLEDGMYRAKILDHVVTAETIGELMDALKPVVGPDGLDSARRSSEAILRLMRARNQEAHRRWIGDGLLRRFAFRTSVERQSEAGLFVYLSAVAGLAAFHWLGIAPAWLGFVAAWLPASVLATLAGAGHE